MQPIMCRVSHDPENGKYGDCLRACLASILELDAEKVPHFNADGAENEIVKNRIDEFLKSIGLCVATFGFSSDNSLKDILAAMNYSMPFGHYILVCSSGGTNHAVVCQSDQIIHNPAWFRQEITGPTDSGYWYVNCLVKL